MKVRLSLVLVSLAGPLAEASRIWKSKRDMHLAALFSCGSDVDYRDAETVLDDYKKLSKRRHGIRHFENRTRDLVLKSWPAIDALAKTLLVKETLNHDGAYAVVEPFLESL